MAEGQLETDSPAAAAPPWNQFLRALREARGMTQDAWAGRLGVGRATLQRWERGDVAPGAYAEQAVLALCGELALFRDYAAGPLRGLRVTPELVRDLLSGARLGVGAAAATAPLAAAANGAAPRPRPAGLPAPLTSFVGRERDVAEVRALLSTARLLTLAGAGGIGKTRLALQVAADLEGFDGVCFVDLAALTDAALVPATVADALGLREEAGQPSAAAIVARLGATRSLLMLDNCEHLLAACSALAATLLRECPALTLLATSRAPLGIGGETVWRVPWLSLPGEAAPDPVAALTGSEAARLFLDRALVARPGFSVTPENAPAVAEICRRLDGIPLALELAAARVKALSVEQIAARLGDRLRLLTGGASDALPRQRTLRAALDWSHDLLEPGEQAALRRLSVFAGGFSLEAAESVCAGAGIEREAVLDLLEQLIDRSLLGVAEQRGESRFRLPETVREYAAARMEAAGESAQGRDLALVWCAELAAAAEPELRGPEQGRWLERLDLELENLRVALDWGLQADPVAALRLASTLRLFWFLRGYAGEGRLRFERGLAAAAAAPAGPRAQALDAAAALAHSQGDSVAAVPLIEASLALWRAAGDVRGLAGALNTGGVVAKSQGDLVRAEALFTEALALMREADDPRGVTTLLNNLGALALDRGDWQRVAAFSEESLALKRRLGDRAGIVVSLHNLAEAARCQGEYARAAELLEGGLRLAREVGGAHRVAQSLHSLAIVRLRLGDTPDGEALLRDSAALFAEIGERWGAALCLEGLAEAAVARQEWTRAARLLGAAAATREALGTPLPPADQADLEPVIAAARAGLGETAFARALRQGRTLPAEQALAEAPGPDAAAER